MSLEEKINFLQIELTKDPNAYPELKREVEEAFTMGASTWRDYKKSKSGYQLVSFTLLTGMHNNDEDVLTGNYSKINSTSYVALLPVGVIKNLPYFKECRTFRDEEEFKRYIESFKDDFIRYLTFGEYSSSNPKYYRFMQTADEVLKDLQACGKAVILESINLCYYQNYDGHRVSCEAKKCAPLGSFVTDESGKVYFKFACDDLKNDIMFLAGGGKKYQEDGQMTF